MKNNQYNSLQSSLLGTRKTLIEACEEHSINLEDVDVHNLLVGQCCSCRVWHRTSRLIDDLDGNPICSYCEELIGL